MDLYEGILTRRSIRRWKDMPIEEEVMKDILKAGMYAPSSHNVRNWRFVVVTDQAKKELLGDVQPYIRMVKGAPVVVVICGDTSISQEAEAFWVQNCSAATQNILLAAHSKGVGAVWCGVHPMPDAEMAVQSIVELPSHIKPLGIVAMGYPERNVVRQPDRFDETMIHYNTY